MSYFDIFLVWKPLFRGESFSIYRKSCIFVAMKKMILSSLLVSLLLSGCDLMKYHPYVGDFDGERHLT